MSATRLENLHHWLERVLPTDFELIPLAGDASFRRYFRVKTSQNTYIAMDSPPEKEDCHPFIFVAEVYQQYQINVPAIQAADDEHGYLLLTDFGDLQYLHALNAQSADSLYQKAFATLLKIMAVPKQSDYHFPPFDYADFMRELRHCEQWFLQTHLQLQLSRSEHKLLDNSFDFLINTALTQPQVCVHRDYHSRNLMLCDNGDLGVLDFQDAVWGPISYDLVSLLRDCYIAWPRARVEAWVNDFYQQLQTTVWAQQFSFDTFLRWFDLAGLQRHLKCMFIFSRKFHRDGSTAFLGDIPRIVNYALDVSSRHAEVAPLHQFLVDRVVPNLERVVLAQ